VDNTLSWLRTYTFCVLTRRAAREDLAELGTDYVDLLLIHAPCEWSQHHVQDPTASDAALWRGAEQVLAMNLTRAIGISNYNTKQIEVRCVVVVVVAGAACSKAAAMPWLLCGEQAPSLDSPPPYPDPGLPPPARRPRSPPPPPLSPLCR
jgi:hypothetical protein